MDETTRGDFHGKRSSWSSRTSCHFLLFISCICSLAFGYFVDFSIFFFNATASQKTCCNVILFTGNHDSLTLRGHVVPLDGGFISKDNILAWCKLSTNLDKLKSWVWFWNTSTLSEFIGYADLKDFWEILQEHFTENDKQKFVREILIFNIFFQWCSFTQHVLYTFSYSSFRCGYLKNQSEYRKTQTPFGWLMPCE